MQLDLLKQEVFVFQGLGNHFKNQNSKSAIFMP